MIEAARVEGASWWQIYRKIVMPLSGPVLATAAILKFLAMYNQYLWPLMVVQEEGYRPVMVGLQYFFQLNIAWGEVMAYLTPDHHPGARLLPLPAKGLHRLDRLDRGQGLTWPASPFICP